MNPKGPKGTTFGKYGPTWSWPKCRLWTIASGITASRLSVKPGKYKVDQSMKSITIYWIGKYNLMVCDQTSDPHQIWGEVHVDGGGFQGCQGSYHPAAMECCLYQMLVAECLQTDRGSCHHDEPWYKAVNVISWLFSQYFKEGHSLQC